MPTRPHTTTAQQLNAAQLAITNSLADPDIKAVIAQYGYTTTKLNAEKKKIGVTSRFRKTATQRAAFQKAAATQAACSTAKKKA